MKVTIGNEQENKRKRMNVKETSWAVEVFKKGRNAVTIKTRFPCSGRAEQQAPRLMSKVSFGEQLVLVARAS